MKKILLIITICLTLTGCIKKAEQPKEKDYKPEIIKLLKQSYNYSSLVHGNLDYEEQVLTLNELEYKPIKNIDIKNIEELNTLVSNTFTEDVYGEFMEQLHLKKDFISIEDVLYVHNKEELCNIDLPNFNDFKISKQEKEYLIIDIEDNSYYIFIQNDRLYLADEIYKC